MTREEKMGWSIFWLIAIIVAACFMFWSARYDEAQMVKSKQQALKLIADCRSMGGHPTIGFWWDNSGAPKFKECKLQ